MIGNDRPLVIGPGDDAQLTRSLGMIPKLTYNMVVISFFLLNVGFNPEQKLSTHESYNRK